MSSKSIFIRYIFSVILAAVVLDQQAFSQSMTISYAGPQTYTVGLGITPLTPSITGGPPSSSGQTTFTLAGTGYADFQNGPGNVAEFDWPLATAVDAAGYIYVADSENQMIRKIAPDGSLVMTFAGNLTPGSTNGSGSAASFRHPAGLAFDPSGNLYVADQQNHLIRRITPSGDVTTFAGSGTAGSTNGTGTAASFNNPTGVVVDNAYNVYVADYGNNRIRKILPNGAVSYFAGTGTAGATDGAALSATFKNPMGVALDASGNIFVSDRGNYLIRKISAGAVTTIAGTGTAGFADSPVGTSAQFNPPNQVAVDASGNLYIADQNNNRIRKITPSGQVTTLAGAAATGNVDGTGAAVRFSGPFGLSLDAQGNIYVADYNNHSIRKVVIRPFTISPALPDGLVFNDTNGTISGTPAYYSPPVTYTVKAYNATHTATTTLSIAVAQPTPPAFSDENYISTFTALDKGMTSEAAVYANAANKDKVQTSVAYFDGLGRPSQTVQVKGNPTGTKDVIQPVAYDQFGRETIKYLPFSYNAAADGSYRSDAIAKQATFYNPPPVPVPPQEQRANGIVRTPTPYARTVFEPSPLNRVLEQGAPGDAWQPGDRTAVGGRTVITEYAANTDQNGIRKVRDYRAVVTNNSHTRRLTSYGWYNANRLNVTIIKDENWKSANLKAGTVEEYKDKDGRIILKRMWRTDTEEYLTYYVYDDFGNLCYVLPPAANDGTAAISQAELDNYCYQYFYDSRNRLVEKKLPGKGWEYIVYNKIDKVIATQDSLQRMKTPLQQALFNKYDALGRIVMSGIYNIPNSSIAGQNYRATMQDSANAQTVLWEKRLMAGTSGTTDYTANTIPQTDFTPLTINYYDRYTDIPNRPGMGAPTTYSSMTKGLLLVSKTAILNDLTRILWNVLYYDDEGRVITNYKQNYRVAAHTNRNYDVVNSTYNFTGQATTTNRKQYVYSASTGTGVLKLTIDNKYIYDHMGRRLKNWQQITNAGQVADSLTLLSQLEYNEIGQLKTKYLHSRDSSSLSKFKQKVDYTYNERGWLRTSSAPLFAMQLNYNDTVKQQYNGNIAGQLWGTPGTLNKSYVYNYDRLNRLTSGISADNNKEQGITYDKMGNITKLSRYAAGTIIDSLAYSYSLAGVPGNQLQGITDATANVQGQKPGLTTFTYDGNGNLTTDPGRGITSISYNLLNLPVTFGGKNTTYIYDAGGQKLCRQIGSDYTEYVNGVQYDGTMIDFIQTEEGRALPNGAAKYNYEYTLRDHLGNSRVGFDISNNVARLVQTDDYYPFGMSQFNYPFGDKNNYLYNNKELQDNLGLGGTPGLYDYGARFYDPVIARWTSVDPAAEKSRRWSPYNYAINNPIRFIDPDGREIINSADRVTYTKEDAKSLFTAIKQQSESKEGLKSIHFVNESETPTIYKNTLDAFRKGKPDVLHYAPSLTDMNRKDALKDYPVVSRNVQRDEYPYASTLEGGLGALVYYVPGRENSIQGGHLSALYATLKPADAFLVLPVPKDKEPDAERQPVSKPITKPNPVVVVGAVVIAIILGVVNSLTKSPAY